MFMLNFIEGVRNGSGGDTEKVYSRFNIAKDCGKFSSNEPSLYAAMSLYDESVHVIFTEAMDKEIQGLPMGVTSVNPHTGNPK